MNTEAIATNGAAPVQLFLARYSANCLGPWLTLCWLQKHRGVKFELIDVDILNAQQMTPEFLRRNPNHTVPALVDPNTGESVFESHTIMRYLCDKFDTTGTLNPSPPCTLATRITWALEFRLTTLYPALEKISYPAMGFSQDFEIVPSWKRRLESVLRDFETFFLSSGTGLIGGSTSPTIADYAIAPCFRLIDATSVPVPQAVLSYLSRFEKACPEYSAVLDGGDGDGFGIRDFIQMRLSHGKTEGSNILLRKNRGKKVKRRSLLRSEVMKRYVLERRKDSGDNTVVQLESATPLLQLDEDPSCVDSMSLKLFFVHPDVQDIASHEGIQFHPVERTAFLPRLVHKEGVTCGGCNSILRTFCDAHGLSALYPIDRRARTKVDSALDFCSSVLRRFVREAIEPQNKDEIEKVPQAKSRNMDSAVVLEKLLGGSDGNGFIGGMHQPTIADMVIVPCLMAYRTLDLELSPCLVKYIQRCHSAWASAESVLEEIFAALPARVVLSTPAGDVIKTQVDSLLADANQELHHLGSVSDPVTMTFHRPLERLPDSHRAWDDLAQKMPSLVRNLQVRSAMDVLPVLDASTESLPDVYLARASSLLAIFGHCYWHNEFNNTPSSVPESITRPWEQVTARLGRATPAMNYEDLYTYNWKGNPRQVTTMRLMTPSTGSVAEQRFYLGTTAISYVGSPVVKLANLAAKQGLAKDAEGFTQSLTEIRGCIKELDRVFKFLTLQPGSAGFVDPVHWTTTVATFAMTFVDKLGYPKSIAPSGNSLPILHILDAIIGRKKYDNHLAHMTKNMRSPSVMSVQHRALIEALESLNLREIVASSGSQEVVSAWNSMIQSYIGNKGFLGNHRRKVFGFILVAAIVGRPATLLDFPLELARFEMNVEEVNALLVKEVDARTETLLESEEGVPWSPNASPRPSPCPSPFLSPSPSPHPSEGEFSSSPGRSPLSPPMDKTTWQTYDLAEVCLHNCESDIWVIIQDQVYDLTSYVPHHPGGPHNLLYYGGLDGSRAWETVHQGVPLPKDLCVGFFKKCDTLDDASQMAKFLKEATLFLNAARVEFKSVLTHRCLSDQYEEFDENPSPVFSPFNFMLALRMYHKLIDQMLPNLIKAAALITDTPTLTEFVQHSALQKFKDVKAVSQKLRSEQDLDWAGSLIGAAQSEILNSIYEVRMLAVSVCRSKLQPMVAGKKMEEAFGRCASAVEKLTLAYTSEHPAQIQRRSEVLSRVVGFLPALKWPARDLGLIALGISTSLFVAVLLLHRNLRVRKGY